ncbi:hypothetical protein [Lactiplantibacillus daowaiensis]|uniref:Extracellular protein n=1 Tax=Lactiplantibacillus daowaiensis TaxID=2559918 RepID=A0ABW1RZV4_9LACO|nr:hypothetical protein [Lactiplantibacillus daowaiensis]
MKKIVKLAAITLVTTGLFWGATNSVTTQPTQVMAAKHAKKVKWHKGTPKTLRGTYQTKKYGADLMAICKIKAKSYWYWASGMPVQDGHNVYYRSLGHHRYMIRFDAPRNGIFYGGKNLKTEVIKAGRNLKVNGDTHIYYKQ